MQVNEMVSIWMVLVVFVVLMGSISATVWFFLRPGGFVESARNGHSQKVLDLSNSSSAMMVKLVEMEVKLAGMSEKIEQANTIQLNRLSSFESRYGKLNKKLEREELQEQALAQVRAVNQQRG